MQRELAYQNNNFYRISTNSKSEKWGIMNKKGQIVVPVKYDEIGYYPFGKPPIWGRIGSGWVALDEKGKEIEAKTHR